MAKLVIFGTGDIGRLAHFYFTRDSEHEVVAFAVDRAYRKDNTFLELPVCDFEDVADRYPPAMYKMFIAISYAKMNKVRADKYYRALDLGYELASYVSKRCTLLTEHPIGQNCFILEDNTIQPFVRIGNDVVLWSGNHIGHDSVIDDHCFISSHVVISGHVHVQSHCFVGVNATIRNSIIIARETLIGAGAVIMKDTKEKGVYIPKRAELFGRRSDEVEL
jgi:sugar O-acyltransferase (sialic acid O-acetyltransferase NeuD family)